MLLSIFFRQPAETLSRERLAEFYQRMGVLVLRRCRLILRDDFAAQDAQQETFVRLAIYGAEFEKRTLPLSWLYRTAERCCFEMLNKKKREPLVDAEKGSTAPPLEGGYSAGESAEIIHQFFKGMDFKLAQTAVLYYVDGLSQEAIAEELGWSRRTVGKKIALLRERESPTRVDFFFESAPGLFFQSRIKKLHPG